MQDLQTLVDNWSKTKDLKGPIELKIFGIKITGKENIMVDAQRCPHSRSTKPVKSYSLPIPNTCSS